MALATLTSKGQVTIPKNVRDALRLHTGDKIHFFITEDGDAILRPVARKVGDVFGRLKKYGVQAVSVEEMDAAIRRRMRETFK